jgi:hypothetical protein
MAGKYHKELRHLSDILRAAKTGGYSCGHCDECEELYTEFDKIVKKIKRSVPKQSPGIDHKELVRNLKMLNPDMDVAGAIRFYGHFLDSEVSE